MNQQNELAVSCVLQWFQLACQKRRGAGGLVTLTFSKFVREMIQGHLSAMPLCWSHCKTRHGEGPPQLPVGEQEHLLSHRLHPPTASLSRAPCLEAFNLYNHPTGKRRSSHHTDKETEYQGAEHACLWSCRASDKAGLEPTCELLKKYNIATSLTYICVFMCPFRLRIIS